MELYIEFSFAGKSEKEKCSALLYLIGQSGRDVHSTMKFTNEEKDKVSVLFKKFDELVLQRTKQNVTMERYKFNMRNQGKDETVNQYITALRLLAKNCNFGSLEDEMIRNRLVCGIISERVKGCLLREQELSLDKATMICQVEEESSKQMKLFSDEEPKQVVQALKQTSLQAKPGRAKPQDREPQEASEQRSCGNCGFTHRRSQCPALGKKCYQCGQWNHFAHMCRSKRVATMSYQVGCFQIVE